MAKFSYEARDGGGDMTTGVVMAVSAGAVIRTRQYAGGPAAMLAWRIGASWCGAVALIYAAFESRAYF